MYLPKVIVCIVLFLNLLPLHAIDKHGGVVIKPVGHDDDHYGGGGGDDHDGDDDIEKYWKVDGLYRTELK